MIFRVCISQRGDKQHSDSHQVYFIHSMIALEDDLY